jgi:hypothetical protein
MGEVTADMAAEMKRNRLEKQGWNGGSLADLFGISGGGWWLVRTGAKRRNCG